MTNYTVKDLVPEQFFSKPVYLDQHFVITAPGMAVTAGMKGALQEWGFETVISEGKPREEYSPKGIPAAETESTDSLESLES